ncbi:hypothetical protein RB628_32665 [Streptomyces sp. ADMS]|uniref:hypothetical protein n=1 Tax=Streptomyces sp. ADMS TaxID=3071415 RepID=UPI00296F0739|nr:hypothetical protein [Streptomyces sp. ADMS]MDW4909957.1 hypothetical protein [Streptomyces sp. ADMS]
MPEVAEPGSQYGKERRVCPRDLRKGTTTLVTPDATGGTATAEVLQGRIADSADAFLRHLR